MVLENKTLHELRQLARAQGITGYSRLAKADLLAQLARASEKTKPAPEKATAKTAGARREKSPGRATERRSRPRPQPDQAGSLADAARQEQLVEDLKFALTPPGRATLPREPLADLGEDIENLPVLADPFICLLPQKPGVLHGYWALTAGSVQREPGLKLRLCALSNDVLRILTEVAVPSDSGHWYFHVSEAPADQSVFLQIGSYRNGEFVTAIRRGIARIPSLYASRREDREWWVSAEQFQAMYERAGGAVEGETLGWKPDHSFSSR